MALARKPKREGPTEAAVQAVIGKGGPDDPHHLAPRSRR